MNESFDPTPSESNDRNRTGPSLASRLRKSIEARRKWSRHCWWIGGLMVIAGVAGMNLSQVLFAEYRAARVVEVLDISALCLTILGWLVIAFAPLSWFWFHRSARGGNS